MKLIPSSLRQKIVLGYIAGAVLILGFALLSWNSLSRQQETLSSGDTVTNFFDSTLEIRRFEKNYFLYRTPADYRELRSYIDQTRQALDQKELLLFATSDEVAGIKDNLQQYADLLQKDIASPSPTGDPTLEAQIREKGKEIVTAGEQMSASRNEVNTQQLNAAKRNLLIGIALLISAVIAGGVVFSRKAVRPLSVLEKHMVRITSGEFSLIPVKFKDREFVSLKAAFNKMLLELRARQDYLVQSEKYAALGTLVFGVAHELNNPLANISTSTQILQEEIEDDNVAYKKELLNQIAGETNRARDIVSSLLNFSRSKERSTFPLKGAIDETVRLIKAEVPTNIRLDIEVPDDITVYADRQKIQQVIINLVKNAIDAIIGGEVQEGRIRVLASRRDKQNAEIVVIDNGKGMNQRQLDKIFDPFFTSKKEGYGLGLFIVHNIIEDFGGRISVDSYPGKGTTFSIILPMKET